MYIFIAAIVFPRSGDLDWGYSWRCSPRSYLRRRSFREQGARHPSSGQDTHYFWNVSTNECRWTLADAALELEASQASLSIVGKGSHVSFQKPSTGARRQSHCGAFVELPFFFDEEDQALTTVRLGWWGFGSFGGFHASLQGRSFMRVLALVCPHEKASPNLTHCPRTTKNALEYHGYGCHTLAEGSRSLFAKNLCFTGGPLMK